MKNWIPCLVLLLTVLALFTGCTSTVYQEGGVTFRRTAFLTKQALTSLEVRAEAGGVRQVSLKGYTNDGAAGAAAIAEGVAAGVLKAAAK